jgi:hypothetical protein
MNIAKAPYKISQGTEKKLFSSDVFVVFGIFSLDFDVTSCIIHNVSCDHSLDYREDV